MTVRSEARTTIKTISIRKLEGAGTGDGDVATNVTRSWDEAGLILRFLAAHAPVLAHDKTQVDIAWEDGGELSYLFDLKRDHEAAPVTLLLDAVRRAAKIHTCQAAPTGKTIEQWTAVMRDMVGQNFDKYRARWRDVLSRLPEDAPAAPAVTPAPILEPAPVVAELLPHVVASPVPAPALPPAPVVVAAEPAPAPVAVEEDDDDPWGQGVRVSAPVSARALAKSAPKARLSAVIAELNEKHGAGLTEADRVPPPRPAGPRVYDPKNDVVTYRKGRLSGTFTMSAQHDGSVLVAFKGEHCGREHLGSFRFKAPDLRQDYGCRYIRIPGAGSVTSAARDAIEDTATTLVKEWAPAHPEAFAHARVEDAKGDVRSAKREIVELVKKLGEARKVLDAAEQRARGLGVDPETITG